MSSEGEHDPGDQPAEPPITELIRTLPLDWPGPEAAVHVGTDPRIFPMGFGSGGGPMLPWDNLEDMQARRSFYAFRPHSLDPYAEAPWTEAAGGVVYFDGEPEQADIESIVRLLEVQRASTQYGAFLREADDPLKQGFLVELRILTTTALARLDARASESVDEQPVNIGELIWRFVVDQQQQWGLGYSAALDGVFGGDGDWARETLAFGLLVENSDLGVYRIWSRAWLVTK